MANEKLIEQLLIALGENPQREGLVDTPKRVMKAWDELLNPAEFTLTTFQSNGYSQMIVQTNIQYYTFCEHHMIPFFGEVHIGYIPKDKIVGISKLPRTVEYFSRRLNTQEYFTDNIANFLQNNLEPLGVGVVANGRHLCQEMRGVRAKGYTTTSCLLGNFLDCPTTRKEFFDHVQNASNYS